MSSFCCSRFYDVKYSLRNSKPMVGSALRFSVLVLMSSLKNSPTSSRSRTVFERVCALHAALHQLRNSVKSLWIGDWVSRSYMT